MPVQVKGFWLTLLFHKSFEQNDQLGFALMLILGSFRPVFLLVDGWFK